MWLIDLLLLVVAVSAFMIAKELLWSKGQPKTQRV